MDETGQPPDPLAHGQVLLFHPFGEQLPDGQTFGANAEGIRDRGLDGLQFKIEDHFLDRPGRVELFCRR